MFNLTTLPFKALRNVARLRVMRLTPRISDHAAIVCESALQDSRRQVSTVPAPAVTRPGWCTVAPMEYRKRVADELRSHVDLLEAPYAIAQIADRMAVRQD